MGNWDVSKPNNDGERELLDRAVKALETEFATKTCNNKIVSEDCISRRAVLEYIEGSEAELGHSSENELVCQDIKELPSVTPKQRTGHWIVLSPTDMYCSECNEIEHLDISRRFCAYCGTRMSENPTGLESEVEK